MAVRQNVHADSFIKGPVLYPFPNLYFSSRALAKYICTFNYQEKPL